jgi:hypothetical protein
MVTEGQLIATTKQIVVELFITIFAISEVFIECGVVTPIQGRLILHAL